MIFISEYIIFSEDVITIESRIIFRWLYLWEIFFIKDRGKFFNKGIGCMDEGLRVHDWLSEEKVTENDLFKMVYQLFEI